MKRNYLNAIWVAFLAFSILLVFKTTSFTNDKTVRFQVFSTSNVYGYLKPCG